MALHALAVLFRFSAVDLDPEVGASFMCLSFPSVLAEASSLVFPVHSATELPLGGVLFCSPALLGGDAAVVATLPAALPEALASVL